jgi:peptidoglycan/LPS O-acetylase OafA/YrhL
MKYELHLDGIHGKREMGQRATQARANNFSILRILFATLVILSHSYELIDGNRSREILTRIFGTISFGILAVDGFFIISGYLITKSYLSSAPVNYLFKRILRIYPGFIVAFIVSIILCLYVSSHSLAMPVKEFFDNIVNLFFLISPDIKTAYPRSFYPLPNGAMWSISYEFHCYLIIMLFGVLGIFGRKNLLLSITILLLAASLIHPEKYTPYALGATPSSIHKSTELGIRLLHRIKAALLRSPLDDIRLLGIFLVGSCYYIFRDAIPYRGHFAAIAAVLLTICMFSNRLAEPGLAVFGGYIIFWFALHVEAFPISKFFNKTDLSYGIYLYAWPIQKVLISRVPHIGPYELSISTFILCVIAAYFSWTFIEKPFLNLKSVARPRETELAPVVKTP